MSDRKTLFTHNGLLVQEYSGPDPGHAWGDKPASGNPRRYAINADGMITTLSRAQWETLAEYFSADCGPECEGPRLDKPLPEGWRWGDTL